MRLLPLFLVLGVALATVSAPVEGQRSAAKEEQAAPLRRVPDRPGSPASQAWQRQGEALLASGQLPAAVDALETALAVDPGNRGAVRSLARAAAAQKLYGKAIRLYGEVLELDPDDVSALAGQGEAMVQRGAVARAQVNLDRIRTLCGTRACPQATTLAASIAKGPPATAVAATVPAPAPAVPAPKQN